MWDKEVTVKFRALGCSQELIGQIIGEIAEHRQAADLDGYERGFNDAAELAEGMKEGVAIRIADLEQRIKELEEA